ncbi:sensor histidine kinase [Chitinibacter sp. S2-10]|uniref:sensor histidine kinase n=1 Tax=Chitinibacter sp. S2-10 TaxID=3373597 RepID=UPI003977ABB4
MNDIEQQPDIAVFLASSVHDMKNSLCLLGGTLEQLIEQSPPDKPHHYDPLSSMLYEVKRINDNLMHLLTLYKMGNQLYPFDSHPQALADFCNELLLQNRTLFDARKVALEVTVAQGQEWHFDADLINGVISHALNNAVKYTRDTVHLSFAIQDKQLEIRVEDNGRGYPDRLLFDSQTERSGVDFSSGSTGLGLYFATQVARLHHNRTQYGRVRLENGGSLGGGCFVLTLP